MPGESWRLSGRDLVALDLVLGCEIKPHISHEGTADLRRKFERAALHDMRSSILMFNAWAIFLRVAGVPGFWPDSISEIKPWAMSAALRDQLESAPFLAPEGQGRFCFQKLVKLASVRTVSSPARDLLDDAAGRLGVLHILVGCDQAIVFRRGIGSRSRRHSGIWSLTGMADSSLNRRCRRAGRCQ